MDSEGKQHEFSNAQWLSKLVFLVDITEKFTIWMCHCKQCRGVSYPVHTALFIGFALDWESHKSWSTTVSISPSCLSAHFFNHIRFSESN